MPSACQSTCNHSLTRINSFLWCETGLGSLYTCFVNQSPFLPLSHSILSPDAVSEGLQKAQMTQSLHRGVVPASVPAHYLRMLFIMQTFIFIWSCKPVTVIPHQVFYSFPFSCFSLIYEISRFLMTFYWTILTTVTSSISTHRSAITHFPKVHSTNLLSLMSAVQQK